MLSVTIHIHRNIFSSQCYIRYVDDSNSIDSIQVECFSSGLELLLLMNDEIIKKAKINTPNDFFIPSSLYSDFDSACSGSTFKSRTTLTGAKQFVAECSFRLKITGADKLDLSQSEIAIDVRDYFKEWFRNRTYWHLLCANCGVGLPIKPIFIESVRNYCDSELSEGWFCHGNEPQPVLQPSSHILYLDDTSFYLYLRPNLDISCKITTTLDKKCADNNDASYQRNDHINDLSTDCSNASSSVSLGINGPNISLTKCSDFEIIGKSISKRLNSFDSSTTCFNHDKKCDNLAALDFKNNTDVNRKVLINSFDPNVDSSNLKQANTCSHVCNDCKQATNDENEYLNDSKALYSTIECQSCGDILTAEKSPSPFIRFYFDKLMFTDPLENDNPLEYAREITLLSFWSLVKRSQSSLLSSKLFLQSKVRGKEQCLLLWIPNTPIDHFLMQDTLECLPSETSLKTEPVYKILYFVGTSRSEDVLSWRRDFSVDYHRVSDTMVKTVTEILDASSKCLPKTSGAGNFSCGFMRAPPTSVADYDQLTKEFRYLQRQ